MRGFIRDMSLFVAAVSASVSLGSIYREYVNSKQLIALMSISMFVYAILRAIDGER